MYTSIHICILKTETFIYKLVYLYYMINNYDETGDYNDWVSENASVIVEQWTETLDFEDMPEYIQNGIPSDDVDLWQREFESWIETLDIDDVPDEYLQAKYEVGL